MKDLKAGLAIPMYGLHYINSVKDVSYKDDDVEFFKKDYSLDDRKNIFNSLEWAMDNKKADFKSIKPYSSDRFSNEEIFQYLENIFQQFCITYQY